MKSRKRSSRRAGRRSPWHWRHRTPEPAPCCSRSGPRAVEAALPYAALVEALRQGFRDGAEVPVRHHHPVARPGQEPAILLLMPAWRVGDVTGVKLVHIAPGNEAKGLPSVQGLYVLFDGPTGTPLAVMDGAALTVRRTAAASALAASYLARPDARTLVMVGAGAMAPHLIRAHAAIRPLRQIRVVEPLAGPGARRWRPSWRRRDCRLPSSTISRLRSVRPTSSPAPP